MFYKRVFNDLSELLMSAIGETYHMLRSEILDLLPSRGEKETGFMAHIDQRLTGAYGDERPLGYDSSNKEV